MDKVAKRLGTCACRILLIVVAGVAAHFAAAEEHDKDAKKNAVKAAKKQQAKQQADNQQKPVDAPYIQPLIQAVPKTMRFAANSAPYESVDIVARTRGFIESLNFIDGQFVKKGDLLYVVEKTYNQADVAEAQGALQVADARVERALLEYKRQQTLLKQKLTSRENVDKARLEYQSAKAQRQQEEASLTQALQELKYTRILSPFSGRLSRTLLYPGELVDPDNLTGTTVLTSLAKLDPLYVYLHVPTNLVQKIVEARQQQGTLAVQFFVSSDQPVRLPGQLEFISNQADTAAGTLEMRALVKNPDLHVFPGQFGYLHIQTGIEEDAMLVPKTSIHEDFNGYFVYLIDKKKQLKRAPIKRQEPYQAWYRIEGLNPDDRVIYGDMPALYPGLAVRPKQAMAPKSPVQPFVKTQPAKPSQTQ
ncbi:Multidrug/solvent efflux pump periplasmic linker protein MepA [BD1-7 clade bacterium]|uniref:Multidrug/solvent efflux pump periplasmic linker protein MepA n=1 Tax=BD1-7 clade bacterium TaxID=2029982 RepID=A0A5S9QYI5_9GAMM|nr:Multidrug/solvent efflux pump periplasmic linker protein MepA [BD1-7 clade bacterium]